MGQLQAAIRQRWEVHEKTLGKVVHDTSVYEDAEDGRRAGPGIWHDGSLDYQDLPSGSFKGWGKWLTVKIIELNR